jgi:hypothetical protein
MSSNTDPNNAPNTSFPIHKSERVANFGVTTNKDKTETQPTPAVDMDAVKSMIGASRNTNLENILEKERLKKEKKNLKRESRKRKKGQCDDEDEDD